MLFGGLLVGEEIFLGKEVGLDKGNGEMIHDNIKMMCTESTSIVSQVSS